MGTTAQPAPFVERRKPGPRHEGPAWSWFLLVVTLALVAGYLIFVEHIAPGIKLYKSGDHIGYNIGLTGGLMMLIMLFYPVRKRFRFMKDRGLLPTWFRWHMVLGILGPALIMFHSTYVIHSINAGVALVCTMLVSGSGIFGRFFYTKIHNGLYGRQVTLQGMQEEMAKTGSFNRALLLFAPHIGERVAQFHIQAGKQKGGFMDFLSIGFRAERLSRSLITELQQVMYAKAREKHLDTGKMKEDLDKLFEEYSSYIKVSIKTARDAAQFQTYERLFSWWHIFHIPLVYMLVFSGIYHVIAVHMY